MFYDGTDGLAVSSFRTWLDGAKKKGETTLMSAKHQLKASWLSLTHAHTHMRPWPLSGILVAVLVGKSGLQKIGENWFLMGIRNTHNLACFHHNVSLSGVCFCELTTWPLSKKTSVSVSKLASPLLQKSPCLVSIRLSGMCEGSPSRLLSLHTQYMSVCATASSSGSWFRAHGLTFLLLISLHSHSLYCHSFLVFFSVSLLQLDGGSVTW